MRTATRTRRRRRTQSRTQIVRAARDARKALVQVIEQCEKSRREVLELNDGGELDPSVVALTAEERIDALGVALVWLQRAENHFRELRMLLERQQERETREVL